MKPTIDMAEVTRLTRLGRLDEAMALLRGAVPDVPEAPGFDASGFIEMVQSSGDAVWSAAVGGAAKSAAPERSSAKTKVAGLGDLVARHMKHNEALKGMMGHALAVAVPAGASFAEHIGSGLVYKLYIPSHPATPAPLIVMLHGCTQSPDDFAAGTRMNELAEQHGFLVLYPAQSQTANMSKCWNWFGEAHQVRDGGEAGLIAGLTRHIIANYAVDPARVFVAGLSAGGAMAAILGAAYPDLYAGIGVHSGLPVGAASDMPSAFTAMSQGAPGQGAPGQARLTVPTIVFHGSADTTVHPKNGEHVITQATGRLLLMASTARDRSASGVGYSRTVQTDRDGRPHLEHWQLDGVGHAWSGGSADGSYTEPRGPDASAEMVRFFQAQSRS